MDRDLKNIRKTLTWHERFCKWFTISGWVLALYLMISGIFLHLDIIFGIMFSMSLN